jgi:hypothetical protein
MLHFFVVHQFIENEVVQNEKECQTRENITQIFFLQKVMAPSETDHNEIRPEMVKEEIIVSPRRMHVSEVVAIKLHAFFKVWSF